MTALAFARAREKGRERKIQERRNDDDDDDDSQMQRRERYLKQRKPWYFYICLWVCVREDFLCSADLSWRKKSVVGKTKSALWLSRREKREPFIRGVQRKGERRVFFSSRRGGENRSKMREKRKKAEEGKNQKKAPKKDSTSPHKKF